MRRPGTLAGDHAVYAGTRLIGFSRSTSAGVIAFRSDGSVLGTFHSRKAALGAISALSSSGCEGKP